MVASATPRLPRATEFQRKRSTSERSASSKGLDSNAFLSEVEKNRPMHTEPQTTETANAALSEWRPQMTGCQVSRVGIEFTRAMDFQEWKDYGKSLCKV